MPLKERKRSASRSSAIVAPSARSASAVGSFVVALLMAYGSCHRIAGDRGGELAKILIVEDNALNIKLFCDLLAAHGHEPQAVTDSRLALDARAPSSPIW